jgi:hypothetical protein
MGRQPEVVEKTFTAPDGKTIKKKVELFTWENWIMCVRSNRLLVLDNNMYIM